MASVATGRRSCLQIGVYQALLKSMQWCMRPNWRNITTPGPSQHRSVFYHYWFNCGATCSKKMLTKLWCYQFRFQNPNWSQGSQGEVPLWLSVGFNTSMGWWCSCCNVMGRWSRFPLVVSAPAWCKLVVKGRRMCRHGSSGWSELNKCSFGVENIVWAGR